MKISSDPTGNRNRDLPACSAVPQPTVLLRAPTPCIFKAGQKCRGLYVKNLSTAKRNTL